MKAHWEYLKYVVRHKWFVFWACLELNVPVWQAIIHDWTKFLPIEWFAYVHSFFYPDGSPRQVRDPSGAYDPTKLNLEFDQAWLHHQRNPHHWQAWISIGDGGRLKPLPIPERYIREMVADWLGASRAFGKGDPNEWYQMNRDKMFLHPDTRVRVEEILATLESETKDGHHL